VDDDFLLREFDIAVFDVHHDSEKDLMFADVMLRERREYCPFVRFVVARFQRYSAPYAFISTPTIADFVQVAADRTATLTRESGIDLDGRSIAVVKIALVGPMHGDRSKGSLLNEVEITAIRSGNELGDFDQLPLEVALVETPPGSGTYMWTTELRAANLELFKELRICEYEVFRLRDQEFQEPTHARRLVYLAHVPVR
jgi:hypothetical protein